MIMHLNKPIFTLLPTNRGLWNRDAFVKFLVDNQNREIIVNANEEGVCLKASGVYELLETFGYSTVTCITNNFLESHHKFCIYLRNPFKFLKVKNVDYSKFHRWNENKVFGCLYNRPLWHRLLLAAKMQRDYADVSVINLRANPHDQNQSNLFEVQEIFEYASEYLEVFAQQKRYWPKQIEVEDLYTVGNTTQGHTDQLARFYTDFLIDIVAETWINGNSFFPTEKTIRPMLLKKPFIVMGSKDYLAYLRQLGFWTFDHFWDEDYDGFCNRDRFLKIIKLIDILAKKSKDELHDMYRQMQYVLDHNYNLLVTQNFNTTVTTIHG
jgi:hypothetical protein